MKLSLLLQKDRILSGFKDGGKSKNEIISDLVDLVFINTDIKKENIPKEKIVAALLEREKEYTTVVDGFAFPHARFATMLDFYMVLAVCPEGLEFRGMDGKPVNFIILTLVSNAKVKLLLQTRASLVKFLMNPGNREAILKAKSSGDIWNIIDGSGISVGKDITAKDIMTSQYRFLTPDMSVRDAARELHSHHTDSLPVIDTDKKLLGDISCFDLFSFGLPDFFMHLKTISFVKHMDPFEKYFHLDDTTKVSDVLGKRETPVIEADATLMEIIFEMTTNNKHTLYVVENGRLAGVIDRFNIIDKILVNT
jgi:mannitol/fructose-specific phosphotransferase system IIA component (Ntr-type)/predicted transcriptional regulator